MNERSDAMLNGALIVIGSAGVIDTVIVHWLLRWHRLIEEAPDPEVFLLESVVVVVSGILLVIGVWRERRARQA